MQRPSLRQAILSLALLAATRIDAAPPTAPPPVGDTPKELAAIFEQDWTEFSLVAVSAQAQPIGIKIRRISAPYSLRLTVQGQRGDIFGAESPVAYEKVTTLIKEALAHTKAAQGAEAPTTTKTDIDPKLGTLYLAVTANGKSHTGKVPIKASLAALYESIASLADVAREPADPGIPPEKVEAALREPWTELEFGVDYSDGCTGPHRTAVVFKKENGRIRALVTHTRAGQPREETTKDLPETETPAIAAHVIESYRKAFDERAMGEESIGESVARDLRSTACIMRGEGMLIGGLPWGRMYFSVDRAGDRFSAANFLGDPSPAFSAIESYRGSARKK